MACLLFQMRPFWPPKARLGHMGQSTTYPHAQGKIGQFFKIRGFHETRVELGVDGPLKTAGHPQDNPRTTPGQPQDNPRTTPGPRGLEKLHAVVESRLEAGFNL